MRPSGDRQLERRNISGQCRRVPGSHCGCGAPGTDQIEVCGACVRIDVDCRVDPLTVVKREFCLPDEENNMKDDMKKRSRNYVLEILHLYLFLELSIHLLNIK